MGEKGRMTATVMFLKKDRTGMKIKLEGGGEEWVAYSKFDPIDEGHKAKVKQGGRYDFEFSEGKAGKFITDIIIEGISGRLDNKGVSPSGLPTKVVSGDDGFGGVAETEDDGFGAPAPRSEPHGKPADDGFDDGFGAQPSDKPAQVQSDAASGDGFDDGFGGSSETEVKPVKQVSVKTDTAQSADDGFGGVAEDDGFGGVASTAPAPKASAKSKKKEKAPPAPPAPKKEEPVAAVDSDFSEFAAEESGGSHTDDGFSSGQEPVAGPQAGETAGDDFGDFTEIMGAPADAAADDFENQAEAPPDELLDEDRTPEDEGFTFQDVAQGYIDEMKNPAVHVILLDTNLERAVSLLTAAGNNDILSSSFIAWILEEEVKRQGKMLSIEEKVSIVEKTVKEFAKSLYLFQVLEIPQILGDAMEKLESETGASAERTVMRHI